MILDPIQDTIHFVISSPSLLLIVTVSQISLAFDDIGSFFFFFGSFEMYLYFAEYLSTEICQIFFS